MTSNPYSSPGSDLERSQQKTAIQIYTPNQIALGSYWGGPLAALYFLRQNYSELGHFSYAKMTLLWGVVISIIFILLIPFLPEETPNSLLPLVYCLTARQLAESTQLTKETINTEERYSFHSNWKVFGIGTLALIIFASIAIVSIVSQLWLGIIDL